MKKTYYYTYKVQCTAVGLEDYYYLGQHTTSNLDDGYKGSGVSIQEYYKQYPNDYTFIILEFYSNKVELNTAEQKLIGDLWKTDPYCLNRAPGGSTGSWKHRIGKHQSEEAKCKQSESMKGKNNPMYGKTGPMKGKHHSEESKRKISEATVGKNNPMYGKPSPVKGKHRVYREDGTYYMAK